MPFIPAPNIAMIEWRYVLFGQKCENRLMVDVFHPPGALDLEQLAINAWDWWENVYAGQISSACNLASTVATDLSTDTGGQFTYAPDSTTFGEIIGEAMPNETSLCISLRTGNRGRSARGRWFLCGLARSSMNDANNVVASFATNCATALSALPGALADNGVACIVSYRHNNVVRPGGPVYYPITNAIVVDTIVDSQRRRKPGVGT